MVISTAKTDLGLRSRTFSLKINKLPTFSEITQAWQCLKIVFIRSDEVTYWILTSDYVLNLRYRPHYSKYKICTTYHKITQLWHHKNYLCQMKECSKFPLPTVFQNWDIDPSHSDYNIFFKMLQNHTSLTLFTLCVHECLKNILYTKFYLHTVFQSWDMEPLLWIL